MNAATRRSVPSTSAAAASLLFEPGRNCTVVAHASRVGLLVDGEEYFRAFALAAERASQSVAILAWDFNSATPLSFDDRPGAPPAQLGDFLNWLVRRRRGLRINILEWDYPLVFGADREFRLFHGFGWRPRRRVRFAQDNTHPISASHHQKIVVIDDAMAFIGGFDLTVRRWDSCAHAAEDDRRRCGDVAYPPFHDTMMAVDGEAARELGKIVRARWRAATGREMPATRTASPEPWRWPDAVRVDVHDVKVALSRTMPEMPRVAGITEVEALYLDMIASARRHIYIENQYFTAHRIGDALAARLAEPDGPEIVVLVRRFSHGWLEEHTMHVLRTRLVQRLRRADVHGRFHVYYPHVDKLAAGVCIDLHAKLMIVDDELLRIGSANLSNRSMGMDSECDATIVARGDPQAAAAIRHFRNRLLGEHLDARPKTVDTAVEEHGSLHGAIEALAGRCRTLRQLEQLPDWPEAVIELASVGDPARPLVEHLIDELSPEGLMTRAVELEDGKRGAAGERGFIFMRPAVLKLIAFVLVIGALTALWRYTPLADWLDASRVTGWAQAFASRWWAPLLILVAYTPACVVMFPRPLITLAAVVAFGPQLGFVYAISGILVAALASYLAGLGLPRREVQKLGGKRLFKLAEILRRRSLSAMTALRLVPVAPFVVVGMCAAAIGIRVQPFLFGTLFGMLPGTLATTVFGDQLAALLDDPARINYGIIAAIVVLLVLTSLIVRRWLAKQQRALNNATAGERSR
ncbi:MAG: phospholipase [Candidatus Accumulibacter phosphatis]|uniref:Phospholipase n=1 Tax=Candidatus Accumulibacter phosphatis TaxID=327160 RepID=A0A6A7RQ88_9PROT|nr:phospholipase [Candidatus Accumulibacter phosphatis]